MDERKIERMVRELLVEIGEDPERGLLKTPHRIAGASWVLGMMSRAPHAKRQALDLLLKDDRVVVLRVVR